MKRLGFLIRIISVFPFLVAFFYALVSCSDNDYAPSYSTLIESTQNIPNTALEFSTCGIGIDDPIVPQIGDTRTYYVITDLKERQLIWGAGDSVGVGTPFIKEENLLENGIQIISDTNTGDTLKVNFVEGYRGLFIGFKMFVEKDTLCSSAMGEFRGN